MGSKFQDLEVWKFSKEFYLKLNPLLKKFPYHEKNNLVIQLNRSALSISNNIAEGSGRGSDKSLKYFLQIAFGSAKETENMLIISKELGYLEEKDFNFFTEELEKIQKMLFVFMRGLDENR